MGLYSAMNSSLSGLRLTQAQMEVVSSNIANVDTAGYTRRKVNAVQQLTGANTTGVQNAGVNRQLDQLMLRQLRTETAGAAYTDIRARYAEQIDRLFGAPGDNTSVSGLLNTFTGSLQALVTNPASLTARTQVLSDAQQLAASINSIGGEIQRMRSEAESSIALGVQRVNDLLGELRNTEMKLFGAGLTAAQSPGLLDERDRIVNELTKLADVRVSLDQNNRMSIYTNGGVQLYNAGQSMGLTFDARAPIDANALFSTNPALRGVGTIRIGTSGIDVIASGLFRSGSIAAEIDMRDNVLVEAQNQLDNLAAQLASALGDRNPTTPYTTGVSSGFEIDLDDPLAPGTLAMKAGNSLSVEVRTATGTQRFQFVATDGPAPNPLPSDFTEGGAQVIRYDRAGGMAGLQGAVATALGGGFTVTLAGSDLRIVNNGAANAVTSVRAAFSPTGITGEGAELPLFTDGTSSRIITGSLDGVNPQIRGLAGRLTVNRNVLNDPSRLVIYDTTPGTGTQQGDPTRPRLLIERLTQAQRGFTGGAGIGDVTNGFRGTVSDFARRVVEFQGAKAEQAIAIDSGQKTVLKNIEGRFTEASGVSIDQEMSDLVQIQNAYAANARVVSAVKELFDVMLRIGA